MDFFDELRLTVDELRLPIDEWKKRSKKLSCFFKILALGEKETLGLYANLSLNHTIQSCGSGRIENLDY